MTIDEAIQHLQHVQQRAQREGNMGTYDASQLGIEALKAWKQHRFECHTVDDLLLPGETEDDNTYRRLLHGEKPPWNKGEQP